MPSLADTIRQLRIARAGDPASGTATNRLRPFSDFGTNPGALDGWLYVPDRAAALPLVVVLHGCTQSAAGYDHCSGWSDLAERFGFAVLFAEQRRDNNPNLCFNWFNPSDTTRGQGEVLSIRQMIGTMSDRHPIDRERVFITGLSAGGAMTAAMLATYPELFAGGSIIAGLPYGAAASVPQALERMRGQGLAQAAEAAAAVERASPGRGPWPVVAVWHGDADRTVSALNADAIVAQWRTLHGAGAGPDRVETVNGHRHRIWRGRDGREAVEEYRIAGLGHGAPLKTQGPASCGVAGPHMLEAGISSTWVQATRWGLLESEVAAPRREQPAFPMAENAIPPRRAAPGHDLTATIKGALRTAGLMP